VRVRHGVVEAAQRIGQVAFGRGVDPDRAQRGILDVVMLCPCLGGEVAQQPWHGPDRVTPRVS
jgi:hypothetical protein